jgi:hypothetical protein
VVSNQEKWVAAAYSFEAGTLINQMAQNAIPPGQRTVFRKYHVQLAIAVTLLYAAFCLGEGPDDATE